MVTYCYVVIGFIQIPNSIPAYNVTYVVEVSMLSVLLDLVPAHSVSLLEPALNGVRSFEIVNIKGREISLEPVNKERERSQPVNKERERSQPVIKERERSQPVVKERVKPRTCKIKRREGAQQLKRTERRKIIVLY